MMISTIAKASIRNQSSLWLPVLGILISIAQILSTWLYDFGWEGPSWLYRALPL